MHYDCGLSYLTSPFQGPYGQLLIIEFHYIYDLSQKHGVLIV